MSSEYYHTPDSVREYIQLAQGLDGRELIAQLKTYLPAHAHILELGSGPGKDWKILSKDYQVTGSDLSKEFLKYLREAHPTGEFLELNAASLQTEQQFDGIYSNKVLHHLTDEELQASTQRQHALLKSDGIICHSFWKGEGDEVFKGMFVNYQTAASLRGFFEPYFELLLMETYAEFEEGDSLLLIGRRK